LTLLSRLRDEFAFLRGNVLVLMTSWVLMNFAGAIPSTYYSLFILELDGTPFIIGIIEFAAFLALASVQFPGGYLADKVGRRGLIVTFTFGITFANLFFIFAQSWHFILVGIILQNVFLLYQPALSAIIADSIPSEKRGTGFSMIMFVNNLATVFSPTIAGFLYLQYGLVLGVRIAYFAVFVFDLTAAFLRIKLVETLQNNSDKTSIMGAVREYPKTVKEGLSVWRLLPRSMFYMFVTNAIASFAFAMLMPYLIVYATEVLNINGFNWALLMTWFTASMILSSLPAGKLTDKTGRKTPLALSWICLSLFPLLFLLGDLRVLFVAYFMFGVSNALFDAAYQALEADLVPREMRGKEAGCSQFIAYTLMSIGGLLGGLIYQYVSPIFLFLVSFTVTLPCAIVTFFLVHEPEKRQV
jgi:MFS family permease